MITFFLAYLFQLNSIADRTISEADTDGDFMISFNEFKKVSFINDIYSVFLLARLHEVHRAIAVTSVVHVPVPVRVRITLALKFSRSPYLDNHSSESIHTWTIDTL